jgi:hypothetical protein
LNLIRRRTWMPAVAGMTTFTSPKACPETSRRREGFSIIPESDIRDDPSPTADRHLFPFTSFRSKAAP